MILKKLNSRLLRTSFGIIFYNAINYLIPLALYPIIIHFKGIEFFGGFAVVLAASQIYISLADFGYTITGLEKLAKLNQYSKRIMVLNSVLVRLKVSLMLFIPFCIIFLFLDISYYYLLYLLQTILFNINIGFFYISSDRSYFVATTSFISKIILLLLILLGGVLGVLDEITLSLSYFVANLVLIFFQYFSFFHKGDVLKVSYVLKVGGNFKESLDIFLATLWISIYRNITVVILKSFGLNGQELGLYYLWERITKALQSTVNPFLTSFIPVMNEQKVDKRVFKAFERKYVFFFLPLSLLIVSILLGLYKYYPISYTQDLGVIPIWALGGVVFFGGGAYFYGLVCMPFLGLKEHMKTVFFVGSISGLVTLVLGIELWGILGGIVSILLTEILISIISKYKIYKVFN